MSNGDWGELGGWGVMVGVRFHPHPFTGRGAHISHSRACFKRWRGRCLSTVSVPLLFLSLTAPPTASSYITPSPSSGPLPAFIGLFLSFSTFAFLPYWPPHPSLLNSGSYFIEKCNKCPCSFTWTPGWILSPQSFMGCTFTWYSKEAMILRKDGTQQKSRGVHLLTVLFRQRKILTWITKQSKDAFPQEETNLYYCELNMDINVQRQSSRTLMENKISM